MSALGLRGEVRELAVFLDSVFLSVSVCCQDVGSDLTGLAVCGVAALGLVDAGI